ncbi:arsenate reductase ArsC, partial [Nocardia brasiliensis]|uniref:arsenate reductase ArsC n=1 Tax=Nocardia brasiliensis TaxID=37326 RepID=UPI0024580F28
ARPASHLCSPPLPAAPLRRPRGRGPAPPPPPAALHPALATAAQGPGSVDGSVLFLCTGNSARSPIAAALLRRHCDRRVRIASAGSHPKPEFHPYTRRILHEDYRIDTGQQRPRSLATMAGRHFDHVITLCDKVREYPHHIPATTTTHWSTADPAAADYPEFRRITTEIDTRIRYLLPTLAAHPEEPA